MILILASSSAFAQQTTLACNDDTDWTTGSFTGVSATHTETTGTGLAGTAFTGTASNLTDTDPANFVTLTLGAQVTNICTATHNSVGSVMISQNSQVYNLGNYVGFVTSNNLSAFTSVRVSALNSTGTEVSFTTAPLISSIGGGKFQVGFITQGSGTFSQIRLTLSLASPTLVQCAAGTSSNTQSVNIYNATQVKYCPLSTYNCNTQTRLDVFNSKLSVTSSGFNPLDLLVGGVFDESFAITPDANDYARISQVALSLGTKFISVKDNVNTYPIGTFAGFEISRTTTLSLDLLDGITIEARLNGSIVDSETGASLLLSGDLLGASSRNTVGFTSDAAFDEIRIVFAGVSVVVGETRVYNAVFERFCEGSLTACNTPVSITAPAYPLSVSLIRTGMTGAACVACTVSNAANVIDADLTNAAVINATGTVGAIGSLSVKKELTTYPAGTFAGFDISNSALVGLNLFSSITIRTYLDGALRETKGAGTGLINIGLVNGSRQTIGFLAGLEFDEIQISVQQLAGVSLGVTQIYNLVIQRFCEDGPLDCNVATNVTSPAYSVFVNADHTGVNSVICGSCSITNTQAVIDPASSSDAAVLVLGASVGSTGQISVKNAITNYPAGFYAGFDVGTTTLLNASALGGIRIRTYLDGVETPRSINPGYTGTGLVVGATLLNGSGRQIVGVVAEDEFDEVNIQFTNTVTASLGTIQIYNAVVQPLCNTNPIVCNTTRTLTAPSMPIVVESSRTGLTGAVCALCSVENAANVISGSTTDFGHISISAGVAATGSVSVKNGIVDYAGGSTVGFAIRDLQNLIEADLFQSITLSTYLNGVATGEFATGASLIDLDLLIPIIGSGGGVYNVSFTPQSAFDEVRLTVGSVASVINSVDVYAAFVTPFVQGCVTPTLVFNPIPPIGYISNPYNASTQLTVGTYSGTGAVYSTVPGTDFNQLPPGLTINPGTGIISGSPSGPAGIYNFLVEVRDSNGNLIGQRYYSITIEQALPITLISFTARKEGNAALLEWVTSEELNSDHFDLERSGNGKNWEKIDTQAASGESKVQKRYTLTDSRPLNGNNYYRLKMMDADKTFAYSHIERIDFGLTEEAVLFPNPVPFNENLRLNVRDWKTVRMIRLISSSGKVVFQSDKYPGNGIAVQHLAPGIYMVQFTLKSGEVNTYKFVKQ